MSKLHLGDCMDVMRTMPDNSVDSVVTDPPYGLSFMGAKWDSFGGSTGRETVEQRQEKSKIYAESHKGAPRYGNSHKHTPKQGEMQRFQEAMTPVFAEALRVAKPGAHLLCFGGTRTFHRMACAIEDAGWEIRDCIMWVYGSGFPKSMDVEKAIEKKGLDGSGWHGFGTCLKPAWEPIIVARKPLDGTVANNVLTHGVGAIDIDSCRVPIREGDDVFAKNPHTRSKGKDSGIYGKYDSAKEDWSGENGRFPANLVHDGSQMVLDCFPETAPSRKGKPRTGRSGDGWGMTHTGSEYEDNGSAARFFYCAKASKKERGEGNNHPTVKPLALMEWLVTLVTPEGGG